ncbi:MAG: patatin-like phospholipase family protein [Thermodesulfobacteriota bacterium]
MAEKFLQAGYTNIKAMQGGVDAWKETFGKDSIGSRDRKFINLALQGGGTHGAFTWGVLDRILADGRISIEGISGTSAGAMNGAVLADGFMQDGYKGARQALHDFWKAVSQLSLFSPLKRTPVDVLTNNWNLDNSPAYMSMDLLTRMISPYFLNPMNINPLRDVLTSQVNFERVCECDEIKLFVSATRVRDGKVEVFNRKKLDPDMVMASACIPTYFQAVEVEEEYYWDGGYMGNPVLYPFAYRCACSDVVIVQVNPLECREVPKTAREIMNRLNEITFNSSLLQELQSIDFVGRLLDEGSLDPNKYKKMLIHMISGEEELAPFNSSSKMNSEWDFLLKLRDIGWNKANAWLLENFEMLGQQSSLDLRTMFQPPEIPE